MSPKIAVFGLLALSASRLTTCRSPGESGGDSSQGRQDKVVALKGIDTSALTARERTDWSRAVSELLSPCPDQPVSIEQCVNESRACNACAPAASYLVEQVRRGRTRAQVDVAYRARFGADQVKNIDLGDAPSKGAPNAPVLIVEFADFECPACADKRPLLDKLVEEHAGKIRLVSQAGEILADPSAALRKSGRPVAGERRKARAKGRGRPRALSIRSR
jgi:hypothetical protein